jgi:hypothetical protein
MEIKISPGNSKIGKIPNISLIPIKDCGNCTYCRDKCYAMKAYRQYPAVRNAWGLNSAAFRESPVYASSIIMDYLKRNKPKYFRIHVAGDFLDQEHLDVWKGICGIIQGCQFMVNTKMFSLDYSDLPSNMHLRFSMWPEQPIPDTSMPKAWLQDGTEKRIPKRVVECVGNCDDCLVCYTTNKDVVFKIH